MPQTRQNGATVPVNSDAYNLAPDLATFADSLNPVITVANQTARDALTKYNGMIVCRLDVAQRRTEVWDGTQWLWGDTERITCTTADATWSYNVTLTRCLNADGSKTVALNFIVARTSGGAFSCPTGSWTAVFSGLIPSGWRPTDNVIVPGGFEFNGMGAVLLRFKTTGDVEAAGVTGSVSMGSPTKVCASGSWLAA